MLEEWLVSQEPSDGETMWKCGGGTARVFTLKSASDQVCFLFWLTTVVTGFCMIFSWMGPRGLERDVVYLGGPIAPSFTSPNAGGGSCGISANEYSCVHHVTWSPNKLWRSNSLRLPSLQLLSELRAAPLLRAIQTRDLRVPWDTQAR
jgi:hypothetical protein